VVVCQQLGPGMGNQSIVAMNNETPERDYCKVFNNMQNVQNNMQNNMQNMQNKMNENMQNTKRLINMDQHAN
jgi:hypothetical protein